MSESWYGHFDSGPNDTRELLASRWAWFISQIITNGIRNGGTCLQVTPGGGMSLNLDAGMALIRGYMFTLREDHNGRYKQIAVPDANPQYPRIDRIALRLNMTDLRTITPMIITGAAAVTPSPPPLTRDDTNYDLSLARVKIAANATAIRAADITDERFDTTLCGLINSALGLDPSVWQSQFEKFMVQLAADSDEAFERFKVDLASLIGDFTNTWNGWFTTIKADPARYISFDFDNLAALSGMTLSTTLPANGVVKQVITNKSNGDVTASRETKVLSASKVQKTEVLYGADGVSELRRTVITTTRANAGITTEIT